ncbi:hypothetical protein PT974_04050 [Cladobotryum mycophilum]|uniref:Uncharacterized protein n=1 Tax=Cladobotryum mycophilum TaxID=491253 RepID=A0ABR0STZ5_9HYPO
MPQSSPSSIAATLASSICSNTSECSLEDGCLETRPKETPSNRTQFYNDTIERWLSGPAPVIFFQPQRFDISFETKKPTTQSNGSSTG